MKLRRLFRKILKVLAIVTLIAVFAFVGLMHLGAANMRMSTSELLNVLNRNRVSYFEYEVNWSGHSIYYVGQEPDPEKPLLLFVHGSPGSKDNFSLYLDDALLQERFVMASLDRPGYGNSMPGEALKSLEDQASVLEAIIQKYNPKQVFLMGHSYGCSVILQLMADRPGLVDWGILVGVAADPQYETGQWLRKLVNVPPLTWLTPTPFLVCNRELLTLKEELRHLQQNYDRIASNTLIIQGMEDKLTPYGNATYLTEYLPERNELILRSMPNLGHFILWTHSDMIGREIMQLY